MPGRQAMRSLGMQARYGQRKARIWHALPWLRSLDRTTCEATVKACALSPVRKNQLIACQGAHAERVIALANGGAVIWRRRPDGRDQVTGFLFTGDLMGVATSSIYLNSARAFTDATLCAFDCDTLDDLIARHISLRHALYSQVTNDLTLAHDHLLILGTMDARERVAAALIHLDKRQRDRGMEIGTPVWLPMRRTDLASYLALELPTLSRTLTQLRRDGLIACPMPAAIVLRDRQALCDLAADAFC